MCSNLAVGMLIMSAPRGRDMREGRGATWSSRDEVIPAPLAIVKATGMLAGCQSGAVDALLSLLRFARICSCSQHRRVSGTFFAFLAFLFCFFFFFRMNAYAHTPGMSTASAGGPCAFGMHICVPAVMNHGPSRSMLGHEQEQRGTRGRGPQGMPRSVSGS